MYSINKQHQIILAVIALHLSATGDTRENSDIAKMTLVPSQDVYKCTGGHISMQQELFLYRGE